MELTKADKLEDIWIKLCFDDNNWWNMMFYDVDRLIKKWPNYFKDWIPFLDLWIDKELPLFEQSDDCIDLVFNTLCPEWIENERDNDVRDIQVNL